MRDDPYPYAPIQFASPISPGDRVIVAEDVPAVVERVIFCREMTKPLLLIEWWCNGELRSREVHVDDVRHDLRGEV